MTFESEDVVRIRAGDGAALINLPSYLLKKNDLYEEHHIGKNTYITIREAIAYFETGNLHTAREIAESKDLWQIVTQLDDYQMLIAKPITNPEQAQKILREIIRTENQN